MAMCCSAPWCSKLITTVFSLYLVVSGVGCGGGEAAPATPPGAGAEDAANAVSEATNPIPKRPKK